jgi:hypothetical protein
MPMPNKAFSTNCGGRSLRETHRQQDQRGAHADGERERQVALGQPDDREQDRGDSGLDHAATPPERRRQLPSYDGLDGDERVDPGRRRLVGLAHRARSS